MNQHLSEQLEEKSTLNADVKKLLDKDAIKELWYNNCYLIDQGEVDAVMESFMEDVIYDAGPLGRTERKNAFKEAAREIFDKELRFTRRMRHNPIIDVNGDEATGKRYADIPSITGDGKAVGINELLSQSQVKQELKSKK